MNGVFYLPGLNKKILSNRALTNTYKESCRHSHPFFFRIANTLLHVTYLQQ